MTGTEWQPTTDVCKLFEDDGLTVGEVRFEPKVWAGLHSGKHPIVAVRNGSNMIAAVWDKGDGSNEKAIAALFAAAPDLLALVRECAAQFRYYEQNHRAKGTPDADEKATVNADFAARCEAAISKAGAAQ